MTLDERAAYLLTRIAAIQSAANVAEITDFAIQANEADRPDLSIKLLTPLSRAIPSNAKVWQLLGLAHRQAQNSAAALDAIARAATLAATDVRIANAHATVAMEAGVASALLFKKARDLSPNDPELLLSAVASLNADGHAEVAEALLARNLAANSAWVRGHEALATLRLTMRADVDFARSFAVGVAEQPLNLSLRLAWQRTLAQASRWTEATAVIAAARSVLGDRLEFDAAAANIAAETGDDSVADQYFARVAEFDDASTRISHIRHLLRNGRIEQAEKRAEAALTRQPAATVWPYLSLIWRMRNDPRAQWLDGAPPMISVTDMAFTPEDLHHLGETLRKLHITRHHPAEQSLRGGTQTEGLLLARVDPVILSLRTKIVDAVRNYVATLPPSDPSHPLLGTARNTLRFAGSWSVRLGAAGFHTCHTHPFGWISSAFYVALPEHPGPQPAGWLELGAPPPDLRLNLSAYQRVEPKPGRLVLFPSTMWHGTLPFADGERLTVAFDVAAPSRSYR